MVSANRAQLVRAAVAGEHEHVRATPFDARSADDVEETPLDVHAGSDTGHLGRDDLARAESVALQPITAAEAVAAGIALDAALRETDVGHARGTDGAAIEADDHPARPVARERRRGALATAASHGAAPDGAHPPVMPGVAARIDAACIGHVGGDARGD